MKFSENVNNLTGDRCFDFPGDPDYRLDTEERIFHHCAHKHYLKYWPLADICALLVLSCYLYIVLKSK